jgi:hypothetical protein
MNREPAPRSPNASDSAISSGRTPAALAADPAEPSTLAFNGVDTPRRVIEQLDQLAGSLETLATPDRFRAQQAERAAAPEDEECLESYLQRYMQQLTGKSAENPAEKPSAVTQPAVTPISEQTSEPETAPQRQPAQAPEDRLRITAMRELANDSARRAMAESTQIQVVVKTRTTYLAAKALSLVSSTLAVAYLPTKSTVALVCATAFFGIACMLGLRFVGLCRKLGRMSTTPA